MLALAGGVLYLLDPTHFVPFTAGLVILGAWLVIYYRAYVGAVDEQGEPPAGIVVLILNMHAYLLGAVALALPPWIAVTMTVVSVLLLTGREQLHALARRLDIGEIITAGQFLILTGIALPLLPNQPVTTLTPMTPRHAWLALIVVCTFSYVSYLVQRYWAAAVGGLWMAALGGLYSSTATTVVLARQAKAHPALERQAQAGITLATAIMYLRILAIVAIFNLALARARWLYHYAHFRWPVSYSADCNIGSAREWRRSLSRSCVSPQAAIRLRSAPPRSSRFCSL